MLKALCCVAVLVAVLGVTSGAQNLNGLMRTDMSAATNSPMPASNETSDPVAHAQWEARLAQAENQNRQTALKRDTDKLLELATQLKQHVDSTGPNILSLEVVKRAQEIEKLAKSVKEKMKGD